LETSPTTPFTVYHRAGRSVRTCKELVFYCRIMQNRLFCSCLSLFWFILFRCTYASSVKVWQTDWPRKVARLRNLPTVRRRRLTAHQTWRTCVSLALRSTASWVVTWSLTSPHQRWFLRRLPLHCPGHLLLNTPRYTVNAVRWYIGSNSTTSISCGLVVQLDVLHVVQQVEASGVWAISCGVVHKKVSPWLWESVDPSVSLVAPRVIAWLEWCDLTGDVVMCALCYSCRDCSGPTTGWELSGNGWWAHIAAWVSWAA